ESYKAGASGFRAALADLKRLDADDEKALATWDEIGQLGDKWEADWAAPALKLYQDVKEGHATSQQILDLVINGEDDAIRDTIRAKAIAAKQAEQELLPQRQSADLAERNLGLAVVLWSTLLAVVVGVAIAYVLARTIARSARRMANVADGIARGELDHSID